MIEVKDVDSSMEGEVQLLSESEANILFFLVDLSNRNRQLLRSI